MGLKTQHISDPAHEDAMFVGQQYAMRRRLMGPVDRDMLLLEFSLGQGRVTFASVTLRMHRLRERAAQPEAAR